MADSESQDELQGDRKALQWQGDKGGKCKVVAGVIRDEGGWEGQEG